MRSTTRRLLLPACSFEEEKVETYVSLGVPLVKVVCSVISSCLDWSDFPIYHLNALK